MFMLGLTLMFAATGRPPIAGAPPPRPLVSSPAASRSGRLAAVDLLRVLGLAAGYQRGGIPVLVRVVSQRSRQPGANLYLLADPNGRLTPLRGNELWQIALLELWLQRHGINGPAA